MSIAECAREPEVLEAVTSGRWPSACGEELQAHVASCAACAEVRDVAAAFKADPEAGAAQVPTAAHVWWRAQMRARQEAARSAQRPLTIVQALAAASAIGLALAAIELGWATGSAALHAAASWLAGFGVTAVGAVMALAQAEPRLGLALAAVAAALALVPVALYFGLSEK